MINKMYQPYCHIKDKAFGLGFPVRREMSQVEASSEFLWPDVDAHLLLLLPFP